MRVVGTGPPEETLTQAVRPATVTELEIDQLTSQSPVASPYTTNVLSLVRPAPDLSPESSHPHSTSGVLFAEPEEVMSELFSNDANSIRQQDLGGPATSPTLPDTEAATRDVGYANVVAVDSNTREVGIEEEPQDEIEATNEESEDGEGNLFDEGRTDFRIENVYEALFGNLDEVPAGFALPDPDDIESFGTAGLTSHTDGDDSGCPFEWDMDYDNDSDEE